MVNVSIDTPSPTIVHSSAASSLRSQREAELTVPCTSFPDDERNLDDGDTQGQQDVSVFDETDLHALLSDSDHSQDIEHEDRYSAISECGHLTVDPDYYDGRGDVEISSHCVLFRVSGLLLKRDDSIFAQDLWPSKDIHKTEECVSFTVTDAPEEWRALLWYLYLLPVDLLNQVPTAQNLELFISLAFICDKYHFVTTLVWVTNLLTAYLATSPPLSSFVARPTLGRLLELSLRESMSILRDATLETCHRFLGHCIEPADALPLLDTAEFLGATKILAVFYRRVLTNITSRDVLPTCGLIFSTMGHHSNRLLVGSCALTRFSHDFGYGRRGLDLMIYELSKDCRAIEATFADGVDGRWSTLWSWAHRLPKQSPWDLLGKLTHIMSALDDHKTNANCPCRVELESAVRREFDQISEDLPTIFGL